MVSEGIQNKRRETTLFRTCFKNERDTHIKYFTTYKTDLQLVLLMVNPASEICIYIEQMSQLYLYSSDASGYHLDTYIIMPV